MAPRRPVPTAQVGEVAPRHRDLRPDPRVEPPEPPREPRIPARKTGEPGRWREAPGPEQRVAQGARHLHEIELRHRDLLRDPHRLVDPAGRRMRVPRDEMRLRFGCGVDDAVEVARSGTRVAVGHHRAVLGQMPVEGVQIAAGDVAPAELAQRPDPVHHVPAIPRRGERRVKVLHPKPMPSQDPVGVGQRDLQRLHVARAAAGHARGERATHIRHRLVEAPHGGVVGSRGPAHEEGAGRLVDPFGHPDGIVPVPRPVDQWQRAARERHVDIGDGKRRAVTARLLRQRQRPEGTVACLEMPLQLVGQK